MLRNGQWIDFVSQFVEFAEDIESPQSFKLWSGIALVAGALERRVWTKTKFITFPNLFTMLVAPPGVGKGIIEVVRELWTSATAPSGAKAFKVAPDSMTKASLIDTLAKAKQVVVPPEGNAVTYHSLLVAAEEFAVLFPNYDADYLATLNSIFQNKPLHEEVRRHGHAREVKIENPQLNLFGGYQPALMGTTFPEDAWSGGFTRRLIMIYASQSPYQDLFAEVQLKEELREGIFARLGQMSQLYGPLRWTTEAAAKIVEFDVTRKSHEPKHSKLLYYCNSRTQLALKLIAVATVSRTGGLVIELQDVERAIAWLFEAEKTMPDIFRAMVGKSDSQIVDELHLFVTKLWHASKVKHGTPQAIDEFILRDFLLHRMPHEKVGTLLDAADRANIVVRLANTTTWMPKPRHEHGVE
jgi:hypothetical protein